jgi:2-methylcitrate dehydratase PrpD
VHQGAIDVLGPVVKPATVHQSKFSMGTVLALVARTAMPGLTSSRQPSTPKSRAPCATKVT